MYLGLRPAKAGPVAWNRHAIVITFTIFLPMTNKPIASTETTPPPRALIIGDGRIPGYLLRALEDAGCTVDLVTETGSLQEHSEPYDYIFQFDSSGPHTQIAGLLKSPGGKMLHIRTRDEPVAATPVPSTARLLYTGPLELWNTRQITDIIFSTLFAGNMPPVTDVRSKVQKHASISSVRRTDEYPVEKTVEPKPQGKRAAEEQPLPAHSPPSDTPIQSESLQRLPHLPFRFSAANLRRGMPAAPASAPSLIRLDPPIQRSSSPQVEVRRHSLVLPIIGSLLALLLVSVIGIAGIGYWHVRQIEQAHTSMQRHILSSDWNGVLQDFSDTKGHLTALQRLHGFLSAVVPPVRTTRMMTDAGSILTSGIGLVDSSSDAVGFFRDFRFFDTPTFDGARITTQEIARASEKIERVRLSLAETHQSIQSVQLPVPARTQILASLTSGIEQLSAAQELLPVIRDLVAKEGKRTYMVLFQNPMELRPTGGFIGSFALVTAEQGKIREWKILDVYDADGQLTGHVDPPAPIRKHLSQPNWFLRDSNFDPDFAISGAWAAWFLQKELGIPVDGVIGVNLFFAQQLLRVTGPITVSDFNNETVYPNTLFSKAHEHAQREFFPGSTQKKDFLTAVSKELLTRFSSTKSLPWMDLLSVMKSSLEEKQVMFFSTDTALQSYVEQRGWAGRITPTRCIEQSPDGQPAIPCQADYLSVVEANLGVNKANYIASKSVHVQKSVNSFGTVATILTLMYDNTDKQNNAYAEPYVNYVRIIVPRNTTLTGVTVNDQPLSPADVDSASYGPDKHVFGFLVRIPPQYAAEVKIAYSLPEKLQTATGRYQLIYQKQSGDKIGPLLLSVAEQAPFLLSPANFRASPASAGAAASDAPASGQSLTFSSDTAVDRIFTFDVKSTTQ